MIEHDTIAVVAVCLHSNSNQVDEWTKTPFVKTDIIGGLLMIDYDRLKVLHRAGEQILPGFRLPPPDSYSVKWSQLHDFDILLDEIKHFKVSNKQLYLY